MLCHPRQTRSGSFVCPVEHFSHIDQPKGFNPSLKIDFIFTDA